MQERTCIPRAWLRGVTDSAAMALWIRKAEKSHIYMRRKGLLHVQSNDGALILAGGSSVLARGGWQGEKSGRLRQFGLAFEETGRLSEP